MRRLIKLFGFQTHDAPGEAEAECALLQRHGIVDAVLSEDVDTIMFGCTRTLRNWTAEGTKGGKTPTHVSMYSVDAEDFLKSGLDREGMVLVALMSGGDYLPEGVPGCGPKVACAAARAGFGRSLCALKRSDEAGLREWREKLIRELRTNESGYFRTRHKALTIPEDFPNLEILRYYTHPVVSDPATLEKFKDDGRSWSKPVDMVTLRSFTEEIFDWTNRIGAEKLVRVLAPSLLVQKLMDRYRSRATDCSLEVAEQEESALIQKISGRRAHFSTDGTQELRVHFIPADIAGLDLGAEPEDAIVAFARNGLALNSDDEFGEEEAAVNAPKKRFDPTQLDAMWIPESVVKLGSPLKAEDFEAAERKKLLRKKVSKPKAVASSPKGTTIASPKRAPAAKTLDSWIKPTKASSSRTSPKPTTTSTQAPPTLKEPTPELSKPSRARAKPKSTTAAKATAKATRRKSPPAAPPSVPKSKHTKPLEPITISSSSTSSQNQTKTAWTLTNSQTSGPRTKKHPTPDFNLSASPPAAPTSSQEPILISSSPIPGRPETPPPTHRNAADKEDEARAETTPSRRTGTRDDKASPEGAPFGGLYTPPRLRLPSEPLDTPPWLKSTGSRKGGGKETRQGTLDGFLSSPSKVRDGSSVDKSPEKKKTKKGTPMKTASDAKIKKTTASSTGGQQRILFPTSKAGNLRPAKVGTSHVGASKVGVPSLAARHIFDDDDYDVEREKRRQSTVSVIDLTGDD